MKLSSKLQNEIRHGVFIEDCIRNGIPKPVKEFQFAKDIGRKFRADYFWEHNGIKLAAEIQGGNYSGGRHTNPTALKNEYIKLNLYALYDIKVLFFVPENMNDKSTFELIKKILKIDTDLKVPKTILQKSTLF